MSARPRLSACLIVRDNERTLPACLASIRPWVDELVVVDTGSLDSTPQIAQQFGARLGFFPWIDDFSAARNASFDLAQGEWLFWMDSDDAIDDHNGHGLRTLADGPHDDAVLGYVLQVHCPGPSGEDRDLTVVDHVKLVRNHPAVRFEGRIHEQLLAAIRRLGGEVRWTDLFVTHSGADQSPEGRRRKIERDLRLLHLDIAERPGHPFVLFNLGMTYADIGEFELAAQWLRQSLAAASPHESHVRKAYALLVNCLTNLGEAAEARRVCDAALAIYPLDLELRFRRGMLAQAAGDLDESVRAYRSVLEVREPRHFTSVDPAIGGCKTRHNLALAYTERGDPELAELQWRTAVREQPAFIAAWRGLAQSLLEQRKFAALELVVESLEQRDNSSADVHWLRAELALRHGDHAETRANLTAALAADPDHAPARRTLCRWLYEHGTLDEAEAALRESCARDPQDASAQHNLGVVHARQGNLAAAEAALKQSLILRPEHPATRAELERVWAQLGQSSAPVSFETEALFASEVLSVPPCAARRPVPSDAGKYWCLHPQVHIPEQRVNAAICMACTRWHEPPERLRSLASITGRASDRCQHLGGVLRLQECTDCRKQVRIKVYICTHPNHVETTLEACRQCPDFVLRVRDDVCRRSN